MSCHAASLFLESFAIEYETVNARLPCCLFMTICSVANWTSGNVEDMNGNSQFPSKMIASFCFPSPAPHQPTLNLAGMSARPCLSKQGLADIPAKLSVGWCGEALGKQK